MKFDLYTQSGEKKGTLEGSDAIFGIEPNMILITQAFNRQHDNARQANAHTKTRGEISYSTKKIVRQKGTGGARHGAKSANLFRKGGVTFGPRSNRNWKTDMPRKQRRKALFSALSIKAKDQAIFCLDKYEGEMKTKPFAELLTKLPIKKNVLIIIPEKTPVLEKSANNLTNTKTILANYLNIADCLKYDSLMFVGDALKKTEETFLKA
ncbi:MAG: 50S ribosomal protein L4 [Candidatus Gracilibacteria bacterium]|nr:50S ribosomal protein L4 [bacterium]MDZ4217067.1 50S ribosomal protein L4 [Candidatus Gracilibacteria bacterium]